MSVGAMNKLLFAIHKWISAAAFVQLAIWTFTGFCFSMTNQDAMRGAGVDGAHRTTVTQGPSVGLDRVIAVASPRTGAIASIEYRGAYFVVKGETATVRVDATSGAIAPVARAEAEAIARADQPDAPVAREATLVASDPPVEYRDCEGTECTLPAWRVLLADAAGTAVWIDASTGDVTARRNDLWRTYDFLWSLHIMDYSKRESFHHPLMNAAAFLALFTVLTGVVLLGVRATRWVRRRASAA